MSQRGARGGRGERKAWKWRGKGQGWVEEASALERDSKKWLHK